MFNLDVFGELGRRMQGDGDIIGDLITGDGNDGGVTDGAVGEHRYRRGAAADIDQADPQFPLIFGQYRPAGGKLFQNHFIHFQAAAPDTLGDVLDRADRSGDDMNLGLQAHSRHAHRLTDIFLMVDGEILRQDMQDLLIGGNSHHPGGLDHPFDIGGGDLARLDGGDAMGIETADVAAGDPGEDGVNLALRLAFRCLHRLLNKFNRSRNQWVT